MAKKSDFARRAESLLQERLTSVAALGELLDKRAEQQAALADTDAAIDKAVQTCVEAGWTTKELQELGVERRPARSRRAGGVVLERRGSTPDAAPHNPSVDHPVSSANSTAAPPPTP